jgi:hypothetical protein
MGTSLFWSHYHTKCTIFGSEPATLCNIPLVTSQHTAQYYKQLYMLLYI